MNNARFSRTSITRPDSAAVLALPVPAFARAGIDASLVEEVAGKH